jgi:protein gp37
MNQRRQFQCSANITITVFVEWLVVALAIKTNQKTKPAKEKIMSDKTNISWTDATWNPLRAKDQLTGRTGWHCERVSPGCGKGYGDDQQGGCYSEQMNKGFFQLGTTLSYTRQSRDKVEIFLDEKALLQPLRWKKPRMIFVCSMTDLFGEFHSDEWINQIFDVMYKAKHHTFQILTKRPERLYDYVSRSAFLTNAPFENLWLGVSAENQKYADERIPLLLQTPATVRFISAEPLLSEIRLLGYLMSGANPARCACGHGHGFTRCPNTGGVAQTCHRCNCRLFTRVNGIHQVIVGGESGSHFRPLNLDHARSLRDQCQAAGVSFFFKQVGGLRPTSGGDLLDGVQWHQMPKSEFIQS